MATKKKAASRKRTVNKSDEIRKYAASNRGAGPTEIARGLAKKNIKVSPAFVSTVLTNAKGKKRKARRGPAAASRNGDTVAVSDLVAAKKLADQMGGVSKAKAALDALAKLQ